MKIEKITTDRAPKPVDGTLKLSEWVIWFIPRG